MHYLSIHPWCWCNSLFSSINPSVSTNCHQWSWIIQIPYWYRAISTLHFVCTSEEIFISDIQHYVGLFAIFRILLWFLEPRWNYTWLSSNESHWKIRASEFRPTLWSDNRNMCISTTTRFLLYYYGLALIPPWISDYTHYELWDE